MEHARARLGDAPLQQVQLAFHADVTAETVHKALDRLMDLAGCRTCGLVGIDLRLLGSDPIEQRFNDLPGLRSVSFTR